MRRREFLQSAILALGVRLQADTAWKTFEITTHVHVQHAGSTTRVWLPTPIAVAPYQKTLGDNYTIDGGSVTMVEREGIDLLVAQWTGDAEPILTLESRVATTDYAIDFAIPTVPPPKDFSALGPYLRAFKIDGLDDSAVKAAAGDATRGAHTDLERARAILVWVTATADDDANRLYVALARAAGLPARVVCGLSVSQPDATRAQLARAEVYLVGYGWTPVDVRERRFGSWDARWIAFNTEQDVVLPGSSGRSIGSFMHPHGETDRRPLDSLDPDAFRYTIAVRAL